MAENLGEITVNVQDLSSGGSGGGSMPKLPSGYLPSGVRSAPPPPPPAPPAFTGGLPAAPKVPKFADYFKELAPAFGGVGGRFGDKAATVVSKLASGGGAVAAVGATVAALAALGVAAYGVARVLESWRRDTLNTARIIGNIDPRIASANAAESIASVRRRLSMSAAQGGYAAMALQQETQLRDALASLSNTLGPLKAVLSGVVVEALTQLIRTLDKTLQAMGAFLSSLGVTLRGAAELLLRGLVVAIEHVITSLFPAVGAYMMLSGGSEEFIQRTLASLDKKLAAIQRNTRPAMGMAGANLWARSEARSFGARNW